MLTGITLYSFSLLALMVACIAPKPTATPVKLTGSSTPMIVGTPTNTAMPTIAQVATRTSAPPITATSVARATNTNTPISGPTPTQSPTRTVPPSSLTLIENDEAAGAISHETALTYKVFVVFGDSRLPTKYQSSNSDFHGDAVMSSVAANFSTLSSAGQATLTPFLIPPIYSESWYAQRSATNRPGQGAPGIRVPICGDESADWHVVDAVHVPVRVWSQKRFPNDEDTAKNLATEVDNKIWPTLQKLMGRIPLSDTNEPCNGGDGKLDIYLADVRTLTTPYRVWPFGTGCDQRPAYIQLNRSFPYNKLVSAAAHEIMHAIQWSYKVPKTACLDPGYKWLMEATADWAQDYVYPDDPYNFETEDAHNLLDHPEIPLEQMNGTDDKHPYGAYLYFQYLARQYNPIMIAQIWDATASNGSLDAVNSVKPFQDTWPEFAKYAWNQEPVDKFRQWDKLSEHAKLAWSATIENVPLDGEDYQIPIGDGLKHLSSKYYHVTFADDSAHSVTFYNGLSYKLSTVDSSSGDGSTSLKLFNATSLLDDQKKGAKVQALWKVNGKWQDPEDWTDKKLKSFCRDKADQKLEELVLIVSNSEYKDPNWTLKPQDLPPTLHASGVPCALYKGHASRTGTDSTGYTDHVDADIWFASNEGPDTSSSFPWGHIFNIFLGTETSKFSSTDLRGCISSGQAELSLPPTAGTMLIFDQVVGGSGKVLFSADISGQSYNYTCTCPRPPACDLPSSMWTHIDSLILEMYQPLSLQPDGVASGDFERHAGPSSADPSYVDHYTFMFSPQP
ncbi:MAG: hypothetical protein KGJ80_06520 [Chloroflexota bacterium]|nr:hypothetical protein [Chloroflexota bacterium]